MKEFLKVRPLHHRETFGIFSRKGYLSKKADGSNARLRILNKDDGVFMMGSRTVEFTEKPPPPKNPKKQVAWNMLWDFFKDRWEEIKIIPTHWTVFGELVGSANKHRLPYEFLLDFQVFDVYDESLKQFIRPDEWQPVIDKTGLTVIEHQYMACSYDTINTLLKSLVPRRDLYEGFVFKTYDRFLQDGVLYGKAVHEEFKNIPSKRFRNVDEPVVYKEEFKLLDQWITYNRVLNVLYAGFDKGHPDIGMGVMTWLPRAVWEDAVIEELGNYALKKRRKFLHLNLDWMRSRANRRIAQFLKMVLTERARVSHDSSED
jgi:hypothetical protein